MKTLEKVSDFAGKYMAIIALAVAIIALIIPGPVHSVLPTSWVNTLLGIVMFGMGMTLKLSDFKVVFTKPKAVIVGICSQFIVMPLLAFLLVTIFQLPTELAVGVILVGCCPGGTSSNVMTYLSKGDVALSVGMTACTTIMAPVVTPALVLLLAGQSIDVSYVSMLMSIVQVVLVPIVLGFIINAIAPKVSEVFGKVLPLISVVAISLIIMAVVSANAAKLMTSGLLIIAVVMLHNVLGYAFGYGVGRVLGRASSDAHAFHRGWYAELRPRNFTGSDALRHHAARRRAWHRVQRVAQHLGRCVREHSRSHRREEGSCSGCCQRQGCRKRVGCESVARSGFIQRGSLTKSRLERVGFFAVPCTCSKCISNAPGHSGLFLNIVSEAALLLYLTQRIATMWQRAGASRRWRVEKGSAWAYSIRSSWRTCFWVARVVGRLRCSRCSRC